MNLQVAYVNCTAMDVAMQQKWLCNRSTKWHLVLRSRSRYISSTVAYHFTFVSINNGWYSDSIKSPQSSGR